jgi:hypothetical protein
VSGATMHVFILGRVKEPAGRGVPQLRTGAA